MAELQDLTGSFKNRNFESGVAYADDAEYAGPEPDAAATAKSLVARVQGIYNRYGRNERAKRLAMASDEYSALKAAGINVFGTPTAKTETDRKGNTRLTGGTANVESASQDSLKIASEQANALKLTRPRKSMLPAVTDSVVQPSSAVSTENRKPSTTAETANATTLPQDAAITPQAKAETQDKGSTIPEEKKQTETQAIPQQTTKGTRLTTTRDYNLTKDSPDASQVSFPFQNYNNNLAQFDKINRSSLRGGDSGITAGDAKKSGFVAGMDNLDDSNQLNNADASVKMMRAAARNTLQDERESMKRKYNDEVSSAARQDQQNNRVAGYQTESGDSQIAMQTGEVQDRSQFGGTKVYGRETYKGPGGKEFVGNKTSEGFIGLPSKNQNEADAYNKGMIEVPDNSRRNQNGADVATANKYNISSQNPNSAYLGQGTKDNYETNAGEIGNVKDSLPSNYQKKRFGEDVKKYTTGNARPAEDSNLTDAEYKKKKSGYVGPSPKV